MKKKMWLRRLVPKALSILASAVIIATTGLTALLTVPARADVPDWTIVGKAVYIDDANVYLSASPHTLASSGWVEFTVLSKKYSGEVDVGWGFSDPTAYTSKPQIWRNTPHTINNWVTTEITDQITLHNITDFVVLTPGSVLPDVGTTNNTKLARVWCDEYPGSAVIAFLSQTGDNVTRIVTLNINTIVNEPYTQWYPDWSTVNRQLSSHSIAIGETNRWQVVSLDAPIVAGITYKMRVWVEIPWAGQGRTQGKYFFGIKPHNETMAQAKASGHLYYLDPWWDANWDYRNILSFNATALTENLTNFPVTIFLTPARVDFSKISANGTDIRFVDKDDITPLPYHITQWSDTPGSENATIVVTVPQIDLGSNYSDYIYMYYGNALAADAQDKNAVWASTNATMVLPLYTDNNSGATVYDSTSYGNNGTVTGAIWGNQGRTFDGGDDKIAIPHNAAFNLTTELTIISWIKPTPQANKQGDIVVKTFGAGKVPYLFRQLKNTTKLVFLSYGGVEVGVTSTQNITASVWQQVAVTFNNGSVIFYVSANPETAQALEVATLYTNAATLYIGTYDLSDFYKGTIGEVLIYNDVRTAQEIKYTKLSEQYFYTGVDGGFIYYGNEDPPPTMATFPAIGVAMDKDGVTGGNFSGNLTSLGGAPTANVTFEYGLLGTLTNETAIQAKAVTGNFTDTIPPTLTPGASYQYRAKGVNVDGTGYGDNVTFTFTMPTVSTLVASGITMNRDGVTGGNFSTNITSMGVATNVTARINYGTTTSYGTNTANATKSTTGSFSTAVSSNLTLGQTYYYRAQLQVGNVTVNGTGTSFTFTMPTVVTLPATGVTMDGGTHATINAQVASVGKASDFYVFLQWGESTAYGTNTADQILGGIGAYLSNITHFEPTGTHHFRAGIRVGGVYSYGADSIFSTGTTPIAAGYAITWWGVLLAIIAGLVTGVLTRLDSWEEMLVWVMLCVVAYVLAQAIMISLW